MTLRASKDAKPAAIAEWDKQDRAEEGADRRHHGRARGEIRLRGEEHQRLRTACARRADSLAAVGSHGGGLMAELGSHQLDASSIFISAQSSEKDPQKRHVHPLTVTGARRPLDLPGRSRLRRPRLLHVRVPGQGLLQGRDTHDVADESKKIVVTYSSINGNGYGGYGEIVFGTKGTLILEQEQDAMLFKGSSTSTQIEVVTERKRASRRWTRTKRAAAPLSPKHGGGGPVSRGYREEIEHWAWCIRNPAPENKPHCTPEVALGRRGDRAHRQSGDPKANADRVQAGTGSTPRATKRPTAASRAADVDVMLAISHAKAQAQVSQWRKR